MKINRFAKLIVAALLTLALVHTGPAFAVENTISVTNIAQTGTAQTLAAANADGSKFLVASGSRTFLVVTNSSGGSINVTVEVQTPTLNVPGAGSVTISDIVVAVPAGATRIIGPIAPAYVDSSGYGHVTYSAVTSVTAAAFYLPGIN